MSDTIYIKHISGYNVTTMTRVTTKLVKDGNSTAIRIPKALLEMSGLSGAVELEAKKGQVIIRLSKQSPRAGWNGKIKALSATREASVKVWNDEADFKDWENTPWNGPSFEEWKKQNEEC